MSVLAMVGAAVLTTGVCDVSDGRRLDGAFIQFDGGNKQWKPCQWRALLDRMQAVKCSTIILQYLQKRDADDPATKECYLPAGHGDNDPVEAVLDYADCHPGMTVFIGLRLDRRLENSEFLYSPGGLRSALKDELPRQIKLAKKVASKYKLKQRRSFAGWYLPVEVANFKEKAAKEEDRWIGQLSRFTASLAAACRKEVPRPVAVSPYFNGRLDKDPDLVPADVMGENYARFLKGTGINIVMLQDGVGVGRVPTADVEGYVRPYLLSIQKACREAAGPGQEIEFWLNVESICADIGRLKKQMELGRGRARRIVTFEFPHHLGQSPLYDDYLRHVQSLSQKGEPVR